MKLLRIIRFDQSDNHVFARAAEPDEWSVSGASEFAGLGDDEIKGKTRQAFANGFLGVPSLGRSTFATVATITQDERDELHMLFARTLVEEAGAPSLEQALSVAQAEISFAADLCAGKPINTVFTVRRVIDKKGQFREEFREIKPPTGEPQHARIWDVSEADADG
ncbi:MAG: hypothetical protein HKN11_10175 [Rhizobiales bacterium]|nr:hypothetical protein [Hyphomicrobiales bacterium]